MVHGRLECGILKLQRFRFEKTGTPHKHVKLQSTSRNMLVKCAEMSTKLVEQKISNMLSDLLEDVFNGFSCDAVQHVDIFATIPSNDVERYSKILLCVSRLDDEITQNTTEHHSFLRKVLSVFCKDSSHVAVIIEDNTSANEACSR